MFFVRYVVFVFDLGGDFLKESILYEIFDFNIEDKLRYGVLDMIVDLCFLIFVLIFRNWIFLENFLSEFENYRFLYDFFIEYF